MKISNLTQTLTGSLALLTSLLLLTPNAAQAAAFTPGNLVVYRAGDGSAALANTATAGFLVEYTPAGTLVQSIALPTATAGANQALTCSGTATSEGFITRSTDGRYISCVGYNAAPGTTVLTVSAATINRVVGRVGLDGTIDSTTALSDAYNSGNIRGVVSSDGSGFWVTGTASTGGAARYATYGGTTSVQLNATPTNVRVAGIFNNQLYFTTASGFAGVATVGSGLPTTSGQTVTELPGMPTTTTGHSPYGFWFKDANTLYVADDGAFSAGGGIQKWTFSGGTWSLAYTLLNNGTATTACRGLTGTVVGGNAVLYAISTASGTPLITVTDTGAGSTATTLATAPANTAFRSVAFGPVPALALAATAAPAAGPITKGASAVPVFGFQLSPFQTTAGFSTLALTTAGSATASDMSNFRVVEDVNGNGTYEPGTDTLVSGAGQAMAGTINFTIGSEGSFTTVKNFLVIADVAAGATPGHTFTGSIAAGGAGTTPAAVGSATGNRQTIGIDMTLASAGGESATLSSLLNDAGPLSAGSGAPVWQVTVNNPPGNAGAGTISALTFTKGTANTVTNWSTVIQAADLFDGSTRLASGTVSATNIVFSGLSVVVADATSKTLSLRISLVSTPTLNDNTVLQFALAGSDVTSSGNGVITSSINSASGQNKITVTATKLAFASPNSSTTYYAIVSTAFPVTVQAQDANGNLDLDASGIGVTVTKASGPGGLTGVDAFTLAAGSVTWPTAKLDAVGNYTLTATPDAGYGLSAVTSGTITIENPATLTAEVVMPQYMEGNSSGNNRLPFAYRVTLGSLLPNTTYRYFNQCVADSDGATPTVNGAGNYIIASPSGSFVWANSATGNGNFATPGTYGTFTTDGGGFYTGWFIAEPTSNTRFTTAGNQVYMQIMLNNGADGTFVLHRVKCPTAVTILSFGTTADANTGTAIYGTSYAKAKNFVLLYDNAGGAGRPLAATVVEDDGAAAASYAAFYTTSVNGIAGAWGTIIPNLNANGVQRIEQRALADGSVVLASTDADGVWPSTANTVNPATGTTPIAIAATDAPLGVAPTVPRITHIQVSGTSVLIDFTGGTSDTTSDFTVLGTADLRTALAPISSGVSFSSSGPGLFRATVTSSAPAAFYRIKR